MKNSVGLDRCLSQCAGESVSAGDEAGLLQSFSGGEVVDVAAAGGDLLQFVGGAFEFLDEEGAQAAAAVRFGDGHEDVAIARVVVIEEAAGGEELAVLLEKKFGAFVESSRGTSGATGRHGAATDDT